MSREQQQTLKTATNTTTGNFSPSDNPKSKKIFVGGLPSTLTEDEFRQYFEEYGNVTDVVIMYDSTTGRPRGFGFITFTSEDCVDRVLQKTFHELKGKLVEVKRALPKDAAASRGPSRTFSNFSTNESYNSPLGNSRMVAQPPQAGGYPPYYGYAGNSNPGYGVYGNTNPAGVYGNLSMPNTDFLKNQWGSHNQQGSYSGYGQTANYGGGSMPWGDASRNSGGYGAGGRPPSKGYGYNGYGGDDAANAYGGGNHEGNWRPEN